MCVCVCWSPSTANGGGFISPALRNRKPLYGQLQRASASQHHSRERRSHLGAKGEAQAVLVAEIVHLFSYILSTLTRVQLLGFHQRGVVFDKAMALCCMFPLVEQPNFKPMTLRIKITCSLRVQIIFNTMQANQAYRWWAQYSFFFRSRYFLLRRN